MAWQDDTSAATFYESQTWNGSIMQRYSVIGIGRLQENSQRNLKRKEMESGGLRVVRRSLPAITKSILVCKRKHWLLVSNLFHTVCKFYISNQIENATKILL